MLKHPIIAVAAFASIACYGQQPERNPFKLKSGKIIYPKVAGPIVAPNMPNEKGFSLSYETSAKIDNRIDLEKEAKEVWLAFRADFEQVQGITYAVLQADEPPKGMFIQENRSFRFVIERKPDGSWVWLKDKPKTSK